MLPVKGFVMRVSVYGQYRIEAVLTKGADRQPNVNQIKVVTIPRMIPKTKSQKSRKQAVRMMAIPVETKCRKAIWGAS